MMAMCEEKRLLDPYDGIPIVGMEGTVVKTNVVTFPTIFTIAVGRPEYFPTGGRRGARRVR